MTSILKLRQMRTILSLKKITQSVFLTFSLSGVSGLHEEIKEKEALVR